MMHLAVAAVALTLTTTCRRIVVGIYGKRRQHRKNKHSTKSNTNARAKPCRKEPKRCKASHQPAHLVHLLDYAAPGLIQSDSRANSFCTPHHSRGNLCLFTSVGNRLQSLPRRRVLQIYDNCCRMMRVLSAYALIIHTIAALSDHCNLRQAGNLPSTRSLRLGLEMKVVPLGIRLDIGRPMFRAHFSRKE